MSKSPRGNPANSNAARAAAIRAVLDSGAIQSVHQPMAVYPRYTIMLHTAWTHQNNADMTTSPTMWQWERERRLYALITALNGKRFVIDGNESRILVEKATNFTEQIVCLEFFDREHMMRPDEFIAKDPFTLLDEYGITMPPKPDPRAVIADVGAQLAAAKKAAAKPAKTPAKTPAAPPVKKTAVKQAKPAVKRQQAAPEHSIGLEPERELPGEVRPIR